MSSALGDNIECPACSDKYMTINQMIEHASEESKYEPKHAMLKICMRRYMNTTKILICIQIYHLIINGYSVFTEDFDSPLSTFVAFLGFMFCIYYIRCLFLLSSTTEDFVAKVRNKRGS